MLLNCVSSRHTALKIASRTIFAQNRWAKIHLPAIFALSGETIHNLAIRFKVRGPGQCLRIKRTKSNEYPRSFAKKERKSRRILPEARRVCCGETWSGNPRACLGGLLYLFQMNFPVFRLVASSRLQIILPYTAGKIILTLLPAPNRNRK